MDDDNDDDDGDDVAGGDVDGRLEFWLVRFDVNKLQGSLTKERLATPWQSVTAVETQTIFKRQEL